MAQIGILIRGEAGMIIHRCLERIQFCREMGGGDSGMKDELVLAVKLGRPDLCVANFDYSARLAEICQLGNVAILEGNEIEWNPLEMKLAA